MTDIVIRVQNLGKKCLIRHRQEGSRYKVLRDVMADKFKHIFNPKSKIQNPKREEFWALKDISFEIKQGETVGIIGRNGAGKSTLLKLLSRITEPTAGRIELEGRVASLLEVGTGFHQELTGRENIYLNGAVLGMTRSEVRKKFDKIVSFAEVEKFLDTPVKRYSSGMYMRLAFAVAAHLEPEILIVDEVLAVGDAQFQKKCLGKMQDISAKEGRTVLFVSHNMAAVSTLTKKVIFLEEGRLQFIGPTTDGITHYLRTSSQIQGAYDAPAGDRNDPFVSKIRINSELGTSIHISGDEMKIHFELRYAKPIKGACFSFQIVNQYQQPVIHCWIYDCDIPICRSGESTVLICRLPRLALNIGGYHLITYFSEPPGGRLFEKLEGVCNFNVEIVGKQTLFGWRPDACAYLESYEWSQL